MRQVAIFAGACLALGLCWLQPAWASDAEQQAQAAYQSAQQALQEGAWTQAELHFERVLMFNPDHAEARVQLALLLARRGDFEAASAFLLSLINDPRTPVLHRLRLQELLAQLQAPRQAYAPPLEPAVPQPMLEAPFQWRASIAVGRATNPYSLPGLASLTLTTPNGAVNLPLRQTIAPTTLRTASLSVLAHNQCGFEATDQSAQGVAQSINRKLLVFCYTRWRDQPLQIQASTQQSAAGDTRHSAGLSWPVKNWRLSALLYAEPSLQRRGYLVRAEGLHTSQGGAQYLYYAEAEHAATGLVGNVRVGAITEQPLTDHTKLQAQLSWQRDLGGYSPLLAGGATRQLALAEIGLRRHWGQWGGWGISTSLYARRRWSNLALFNMTDAGINAAAERQF